MNYKICFFCHGGNIKKFFRPHDKNGRRIRDGAGGIFACCEPCYIKEFSYLHGGSYYTWEEFSKEEVIALLVLEE